MQRVMDKPSAGVKEEQMTALFTRQMPTSGSQDLLDYSHLYGDLCRKLLNTPVTEIFSGTSHNAASSSLDGCSVITSGSNGAQLKTPHCENPNTATKIQPEIADMSPFGGMYNQTGVFEATERFKKQDSSSILRRSSTEGPQDSASLYVPSLDLIAETHEPIDIQALVDQFKMTLERYGVSQRFAARFIMQDTSQGNLSFLMEKGRIKKWEELSPRGRIPYIKMKAWLESKDLQMNTLNMLKYSQDVKRNSPKECYNRRERFSMFQLHVLCRLFEENQNPPMNVRNAVAERLNIPLDRINVWFQNQRARGFPARRILQQHSGLYSDDPLKSDMEIAKDITQPSKNVAELDQQPFCPPVIKESVSSALSRETNHYGIATKVKVEPCDSNSGFLQMSSKERVADKNSVPCNYRTNHEQPLDLSGAKADDIVGRQEPDDLATCKTATKVTGASKRKRGFKPQQIVQRSELPKTKGNEPNENEIKRRRISDPVEYNYQLEDDCSETKEYNYVIDTKHDSIESCAVNTAHSNSADDGRVTQYDGTVEHRGTTDCVVIPFQTIQDGLCIKEEILNETDDKTEILLQAMCASIAMEKKAGNQSHEKIIESVTLLEPDLD